VRPNIWASLRSESGLPVIQDPRPWRGNGALTLVSRCLSAAGIRFPAILSRHGIPPLLRSAYRHQQVPDHDGVPTFRTRE